MFGIILRNDWLGEDGTFSIIQFDIHRCETCVGAVIVVFGFGLGFTWA